MVYCRLLQGRAPPSWLPLNQGVLGLGFRGLEVQGFRGLGVWGLGV